MKLFYHVIYQYRKQYVAVFVLLLVCPLIKASSTEIAIICGMSIHDFLHLMIVALMVDDLLDPFSTQPRKHTSNRLGTKTKLRIRRSVASVFEEIGRGDVKAAYRMSPESFWKFLDLIYPYINTEQVYEDDFDLDDEPCDDNDITDGREPVRKKQRRHFANTPAPNGTIDHSIRLAVALRYMSGGAVYDLIPLFGISKAAINLCVRQIVDAINRCPHLKFEFPSSHDEQKRIAAGFYEKSQANFTVCCGAIDGFLVWTSKPMAKDTFAIGFMDGKFWCGRKHKFGLNLMGVCDASSRFLEVEIGHPASTSDHLAFLTSDLYQKLIKPGFLAQGLCLFGDNAYVNTEFMATPYNGNHLTHDQDSYNYYHSSLRIRIECAFGMLTRRFGLLRRCFHQSIPIFRINAIVMAMCRIHNYCLDEREMMLQMRNGKLTADIPELPALDEFVIDSIGVHLETTDQVDLLPVPLLDAGEHFDDCFANYNARRQAFKGQSDPSLPRQKLCRYVDRQLLVHPPHNISRNRNRIRSQRSSTTST
jgi:hypothetical protein